MPNRWIEHVRKVRAENPELSYKQALQEGKKTYVRSSVKTAVKTAVKTSVKTSSAAKALKGMGFTQRQKKSRVTKYTVPQPSFNKSFNKSIDEKLNQVRKQARPRRMKKKSRVTKKVQQGMGLLDRFLKHRPSKFQKFLDKHKNMNVVKLEVCRTPLTSYLRKSIDFITFNGLKRAEEKHGYDSIFHLYTILTFENGKRYIFERNANVQIFPLRSRKKAQCRDDVQINPIKFGELVLKMEADAERLKSNLYIYDPFKNNCQRFTATLLFCAGIPNTHPVYQFVVQNVEEAFTSKAFKLFSKTTTDIAAIVQRILKGGGCDC